MQNFFRAIPSIDLCLAAICEADAAIAQAPRRLLRELVATYWDEMRAGIRSGAVQSPDALSLKAQLPSLLKHARQGLRPYLRRVLNGAGVVIHTNLGRSVLAPEAVEAVTQAASGYCNLEMDLATGNRGSRHSVTESLLRQLTGAEAALVVNNNAAAVFLVLDTLCKGGEVIVSRGELVEIGGSFRIPDIMAKSGAILREVGTTNRTHLPDYVNAVGPDTKAIMRVHTSNYRIIGFHAETDLADLKALAVERHLPLIFDLGSGSLLDMTEPGLPPEPTVSAIIAQGADCVTFSGDKVLGGPQAGIIVGTREIIDRLKKNPLCRVLRCCKLTLAALEATLRLYLEPEKARLAVPTQAMINQKPNELAKAAANLRKMLDQALASKGLSCPIELVADNSRVGGGAFPECDLPTTLLCLKPATGSAADLRAWLLKADPPLIGRLEQDAFCIDPRCLAQTEYDAVAASIAWALASMTASAGQAETK